MSINLNYTEEDWERIGRDWNRWWAGELDRPMVVIENPFVFSIPTQMTREFLLERPVDEVLDEHQMMLEARQFFVDAWPRWWPNFGPGIIAGFLGADVHCTAETATVWFAADDCPPIDKLHLTYDGDNIWWTRILDLTRGAVERWGDKVCVAHTDLGGNLDILASFRTTEQLLYDLYDAPHEVSRLGDEITTLWLRYYDELYEIIRQTGRGTTPWAPIWSPGRTYMLQSDFCFMISPDMFERFILPDLAACIESLDHPFYHLDGPGQIRHLDMLLSLEKLAGIQWIPGDGQPQAHEWLSLLTRIRDAGKLCQVYVSAEWARTIVQEVGGRGFAFYILSFIDSQEEADDLMRVLASEDKYGWKQ
jgi:5-methyltetrahydrofolate--homocysteine methyltransferase